MSSNFDESWPPHHDHRQTWTCPWCAQPVESVTRIIGSPDIYRPCDCQGPGPVMHRPAENPAPAKPTKFLLGVLMPTAEQVADHALRKEYPEKGWDQPADVVWAEKSPEIQAMLDAGRRNLRATFEAQARRWLEHAKATGADG